MLKETKSLRKKKKERNEYILQKRYLCIANTNTLIKKIRENNYKTDFHNLRLCYYTKIITTKLF